MGSPLPFIKIILKFRYVPFFQRKNLETYDAERNSHRNSTVTERTCKRCLLETETDIQKHPDFFIDENTGRCLERCGDGKTYFPEALPELEPNRLNSCDDGNLLAGDGCDGACEIETGSGYYCEFEGFEAFRENDIYRKNNVWAKSVCHVNKNADILVKIIDLDTMTVGVYFLGDYHFISGIENSIIVKIPSRANYEIGRTIKISDTEQNLVEVSLDLPFSLHDDWCEIILTNIRLKSGEKITEKTEMVYIPSYQKKNAVQEFFYQGSSYSNMTYPIIGGALLLMVKFFCKFF